MFATRFNLQGAAAVREGWTDFLKAFFEAGGGFDGIMLDMETGFEVWSFLIGMLLLLLL